MTQRKPVKKFVKSTQEEAWGVMKYPEPDAESVVVTEQWYVRQQLCLSISLAFSWIRRDSGLRKRWESSREGAIKIDAFAKLQPGCTLKTSTIHKVVVAIRDFCKKEQEGANRTKGIMLAVIIRSCEESMAVWVRYDAYERRIEEAKLNANANASGIAGGEGTVNAMANAGCHGDTNGLSSNGLVEEGLA